MISAKDLQRIDEFWNWFSANLPTIEHIRAGDHPSFDRIEKLLSRICEGMNFEISGTENDQTLVISADGIRDRIPFVIATVDRAPRIPGWKVFAFRQRNDAGFDLMFNGIRIGSTEVLFNLVPTRPRMKIVAYLPVRIDANDKNALWVVFLVLDQLIGEYDVMTKVGDIEVRSVPGRAENCDFLSSRQFVREFDRIWQTYTSESGVN